MVIDGMNGIMRSVYNGTFGAINRHNPWAEMQDDSTQVYFSGANAQGYPVLSYHTTLLDDSIGLLGYPPRSWSFDEKTNRGKENMSHARGVSIYIERNRHENRSRLT